MLTYYEPPLTYANSTYFCQLKFINKQLVKKHGILVHITQTNIYTYWGKFYHNFLLIFIL